MAPTPRFNSLVFATIYFLHAYAQVPVPGQSLTFDSGLPTGPVGGCLTASSNADGAPVIIQDCPVGTAPGATNTWVAAGGVGKPGALKIFGDKCLDVKDGVDADGTQLQIRTCASGNTNQQWVSAGSPGSPQIVWAGKNKCVDVTNGNVTTGNVMQIWDCDTSVSNSNQNWGIAITTEPKSVSLSLVSDPSLCIAASANSTSAPVTVENCSSNSTTQTWIGLGIGIIKSEANTDLCLATNGDATSAGTKLVLSECSQTDPANAWDLDWQAGRVENVPASNMCIDLTDGKEIPGTQLQIWNCTEGNTNQNWVITYNF
ncbi:ricin B lectin domain-containing protein [Mycena galopus ATCC 62051]|nr:ricin B lectin domain-containing protein [Mycena galopus ATCC 62051]